MRILAVGDIYGRPGRRALQALLPGLVQSHRIDVVVANAENAAGGRGLTPKVAEEIRAAGVHILTAGNHTFEHAEIRPYLDAHPVLRIANLLDPHPGRGCVFHEVRGLGLLAVISLQGRVFMDDKGPKVRNPFEAIDELLRDISPKTKLILVDFHAEATSEKRAMGWYLNGRVSAMVGTHTHVQTADEEILSGGTAYLTDLGMTGPHGSVVGLDKDTALPRFLRGEKNPFKVAEEDVRLEGAVIQCDERTGRATSIVRVREKLL